MTTEELIDFLKQHPGKQVLVFDRQEQLTWAKPEAVTVRRHILGYDKDIEDSGRCPFDEDFSFNSHLPSEEVIIL